VQPRFNMALFSFFGMLGLALRQSESLACFLIAWRAEPTKSECGWRWEPNGATCWSDARMGGKLVLSGLAAGLVGSFVLARFLRSEVFQVPVSDPLSISGVVIVLSAVAFLACFCRLAGQPAGSDVALRHE